MCLHVSGGISEGESTVPEVDDVGETLPSGTALASSDNQPSYLRFHHQVHPFGWVIAGFLCLCVVGTLVGTERLIGNLPWWVWLVLVAFVAMSARPAALHRFRLGIEKITAATGLVARWLGWMVFVVSLFNVVTRYTGRYVEKDIIIGEVTSLAWMTFGFMFLIGMNYGVREGVNPRIDFWWADFSHKRKAWLDFVMHTFFFLPFIIAGSRILFGYSRIALGMKRSGDWPEGWRVWNTWEQSPDADQLPVGPIKFMLLVGLILFGIQILAEIIKTGFVIMGREDLADIHDPDAPLRIE